MKKLKVAIVIPTHANIDSSLHNLLKVYGHLMKKHGIDAAIFTDAKNGFRYGNFRIEKVHSIDYKTPLEKVLLFLGMQRFCYTDLIEKLKGYDVIESSNPE